MRVSKFPSFFFCFGKGVGTIDEIKNGMASCALVTYDHLFLCASF